jgi:hypothetical protein
VSEWTNAGTPAAGLRVLDTARWQWIKDHDDWFTFSDDEVTAYGAKLMLLQRWHKLAEKEAEKDVGGS